MWREEPDRSRATKTGQVNLLSTGERHCGGIVPLLTKSATEIQSDASIWLGYKAYNCNDV
jgi:hypothetical protein